MGFRCGIVGLPNVGKSTLFNALTETAAAQAANYPFCTIEPNVGRVAVPDPRLDQIAEVAGSAQEIETQLEFVDIAGLVRGASKGEGLGNQFLGNIREVDAIVHVLRCFGRRRHPCRGRAIRSPLRAGRERMMLADLDSSRSASPPRQESPKATRSQKIQASVLGRRAPLSDSSRPLHRTKDHEKNGARPDQRDDRQPVSTSATSTRAKPPRQTRTAASLREGRGGGAGAVVISSDRGGPDRDMDAADRPPSRTSGSRNRP